MSKTNLFCFDIDGTLINEQTPQITQTTINALKILQAKQHQICIATGRSFLSVQNAGFDKALVWDFFVCNNGQTIYNHQKKCIFKACIPPTQVNKCIEIADSLSSPLLLMEENRHFLTRPKNINVEKSARFFQESIPPVDTYKQQDIISMIAFDILHSDYHAYKECQDLRFIPSLSHYADIVLKGFHKAKALTQICKKNHLPHMIAFGDSLNDLEMFQAADKSFAMRCACEPLKAIATEITSSPAEEGIAYILSKYGWIS